MNKNKQNLFYNVMAFLLLFGPFNNSALKIFPVFVQIVLYSFAFIAILLLLIEYLMKKKNEKHLDNIEIIYILFIIFAFSFIFFRNGSISHDSWLSFLLYIIYLPLPLFCYKNDKLIKAIYNVINIFLIEHLIGIIFELLFRNLYLNLWVNLFTGQVYSSLLLWYDYGYLVGFTTNYTITSIYVSIGIMYYFTKIICHHYEKKDIIFLVLFTIFSLMIGKRGTLIFTILASTIIFVINDRKKIYGKIIKLLMILLIAIVFFFILSQFIPTIMNTLNRFESLISDKTFGNRKSLYSYALTFWKNNILFGNGWKTFAYYYKFYQPAYLTGYFDVHNVYLQLLCETGIIGLVFFAYNMFKSLIQTIKIFLKNISVNREILYFSTIYQIFFVLYCLSENPLYDIQCSVIYLFSIGIYLTLLPSLKKYNMKGKKIYEEK